MYMCHVVGEWWNFQGAELLSCSPSHCRVRLLSSSDDIESLGMRCNLSLVDLNSSHGLLLLLSCRHGLYFEPLVFAALS